METQWTLEEAERKLPELINGAVQGEPQFICADGPAEAVVVSAKEWRDKNRTAIQQNPESYPAPRPDKPGDVTCGRPDKSFVEALLAMPQGDWDLPPAEDTLKLRDVDL